MKLGEALKKAIETDDAVMAGKCADVLRLKARMNYIQTLAFVQSIVPDMTPEKWEGLMYRADTEE